MNILTADLLLKQGYTNVFVVNPKQTSSTKSAKPNSYILCSKTGGFQPDIANGGVSYPTVQIMVADINYKTCSDTIQAIKAYLQGISGTEILESGNNWDDITVWSTFTRWFTYDNANFVFGYRLLSDVMELGVDDQRRYIMSINFIIYKNGI